MLYWLLRVLLGPVVSLVFRPQVEGVENVPPHGAAILASNHLSFSDSIFLPAVINRRITFPAKMEYFTQPGVVGWLKRHFLLSTGQIPIDRSGGSASAGAMEAGLAVLRRGELFGIYPEGTRSPDGRLYKGKTGVARMALAAGCPIIPVAMIDTDKAQPTGQRIPSIHRIGVRFGSPISLEQYADQADDRLALRAMTDEVMNALAQLSGQEYVDEYAAARKMAAAAAGTTPAPRASAPTIGRIRGLAADSRARLVKLVGARLGRKSELGPAASSSPPASALPTEQTCSGADDPAASAGTSTAEEAS